MAPSDPATSDEMPLLEHELADADALVRDASWNQTIADWRSFIQLGTVHAIREKNNRVIATAATLPYGGQFAWISMVLVRRDYQRRGLATRLMRRCVEDLTSKNLVPVLDATPAGREVYRALGFQNTWSFQRYARAEHSANRLNSGPTESGTEIHPVTDAIWPQLCAYDAKIFGADRSALLARLRGRAPQVDCFAERDGEIVGLMLGRDGRVATQIGPIVAEDDKLAQMLALRAIRASSTPIFIDVPDSKSALITLLAKQGFVPQRPLTRMVLGKNTAYDDGQRTFAVVGPEFG